MTDGLFRHDIAVTAGGDRRVSDDAAIARRRPIASAMS